jgi:hypothetical protein
MNFRLVLAVAKYLCQHRSVRLFRLVDDMFRDPALRPVFAEIGAVEMVGRLLAVPRPGTAEWQRAYDAVRKNVLYLETRDMVRYIPDLEVVNWVGKPCNSTTPISREG